jgi:hypothetical protein
MNNALQDREKVPLNPERLSGVRTDSGIHTCAILIVLIKSVLQDAVGNDYFEK